MQNALLRNSGRICVTEEQWCGEQQEIQMQLECFHILMSNAAQVRKEKISSFLSELHLQFHRKENFSEEKYAEEFI